MSFGLIAFTNRGRALQAKAQAGAQLNFTRLAVGDGQLSGQAIADLTALIHEIKSITLNKFKVLTGGKAVVGGVLSNQDIDIGFWLREIGLFAEDPDLGEILYCYGNAGELAEYIPSPGGAEILEKQLDIVSIVGNASNVSATIDQSMVYETPSGAQEKVDAAVTAHEEKADPHEQYALDADLAALEEEVGGIADELASHKADNTNNAHKAKNISIEDTAGNFSATDVEGALNELFTSVSNGKNLVGTAITDVDSNVTVPTNPTFQDLADAIGQINTGKKWASGTIPNFSVSGTAGTKIGTISGLDFSPKTVIFIYTTYGKERLKCATIDPSIGSFYCTERHDGVGDMYLVDSNDFLSDGFNYYADSSYSGSTSFTNVRFIAFA